MLHKHCGALVHNRHNYTPILCKRSQDKNVGSHWFNLCAVSYVKSYVKTQSVKYLQLSDECGEVRSTTLTT